MTEEEALKTCTGFVAMPDVKGYFPFRAANFLVGTGKYQFEQASRWGYVLRLVPAEERAARAEARAKSAHGGALDWLHR